MSKNKITFGLKNVHIAFMEEGETPAWGTPTKIPGAVSFTPSPEGDSNTFYADDSAYFIVTSNNGYTGDLEMANFPDEILKEALGWEIDTNGMLVEVADTQPKKFALMGEVTGDAKNRRFVYYDVQCNRPSNENTTKTETVDPATKTMPVTISPIEIEGKRIVKGDLELNETNSTVFAGFFDDVYIPAFTPEA